MLPNTSPYLSIVAVSRNDDHGGNLILRMQLFVNCLLKLLDAYKLPSELIIVEWNPPRNRPKLIDVLHWPKVSSCIVRIIEINEKIHQQFRYSEAFPIFQMIGKNVGIRRAKGKFILLTNIDILFSKELIKFLVLKKLQENFFYRLNRYDIDGSIPSNLTVDELLNFCKNNLIRIHTRFGSYSSPRLIKILSNVSIDLIWKVGIFFIFLHSILGYFKKFLPYWPPEESLFHPATIYGFFKRRIILVKSLLKSIKFPSIKFPLHTNACGDFTLMAKKNWLILRGYPEFSTYSWKLDSILLNQAYYQGFREFTLNNPKRIFHIEHGLGSGFTPGKGWKLLQKRLKDKGIPYLNLKQYKSYIRKLKASKGKLRFNDENWGLANIELPETRILNGKVFKK